MDTRTLKYCLFCNQVEYQEEAVKAFKEDVEGKTLLLNVEYKIQKLAYATLTCPKTKVDIAKELITDGLLLLDSRREKRLQKVVSGFLNYHYHY